MKIGVLIEGQEGVGWECWRDIVRWTEELGFESLWRSDHFIPLSGDRNAESLETFVSLTHVASATSRIRFGSLVCPMTFRHPAVLARMAAAVAALSGGRFVLGLGAGWYAGEHHMFGIELPRPYRRLLALEEGTAVIRLLLSGQRASFDGEVYRLAQAQICPASPVPIVIGGAGESYTLRIAARHADEWNVPGIPVEVYRRKVAALEAHCEREGRDPARIGRSVVYTHAIAESEAEAGGIAAELTAQTPPEYRPGSRPDAPAWLVGTPARVVHELHEIEAEGVSRVMLQYRRPPTREHLELIAAEILPHV